MSELADVQPEVKPSPQSEKFHAAVQTVWGEWQSLQRQTAEKQKVLDALLNACQCDGGECGDCGKIICPHKDEFHFHHDGCPSCSGDSEPDLRLQCNILFAAIGQIVGTRVTSLEELTEWLNKNIGVSIPVLRDQKRKHDAVVLREVADRVEAMVRSKLGIASDTKINSVPIEYIRRMADELEKV